MTTKLKRPAFQFYPADYLRDPAVRACTLAARGLWVDMLCLMHEGTPYGHLCFGVKPVTAAELARMVGETPGRVAKLLRELEGAGVFSRTEAGTIYCRRMVRDEHIRTVRANAGKLGGNPALLDKTTDKQDASTLVKQADEQTATPSSSASSSPSEQPFLPPSLAREERSDDGSAAMATPDAPLSDREIALALTIEANRGTEEGLGAEQLDPFMPGHRHALELAETVRIEAIPLEFARAVMREQAKRYAIREHERPRTLKYFGRGLLDDWAKARVRDAQASTSSPARLERAPVAITTESTFARIAREAEDEARRLTTAGGSR